MPETIPVQTPTTKTRKSELEKFQLFFEYDTSPAEVRARSKN